MKNRTTYLLRLVLLLGDFLLLNGGLVLAKLLLAILKMEDTASYLNWWMVIAFNAGWLVGAACLGLYSQQNVELLERIFRNTWKTAAGLILFTPICFFLLNGFVSASLFTVVFGSLGTIFIGSRIYLTYLFDLLVRTANLTEKTAIIGYNETALQLADYFTKQKGLYSFQGFFDNQDHNNSGRQGAIVGPIGDCIAYAVENNIREVYSTLPPDREDVNRLIETADRHLVRLRFVSPSSTYATTDGALIESPWLAGAGPIEYMADLPIFSLRQEPLQQLHNRIKKRVFDILFSLFVIIFVLSWLTPILAIIILLESRGPVFFRQQRSGRNNQPFGCLKFRSMTVNKDSDAVQATKNDKRITKVGAFLRKSSLDELPQFWNVLLGDMSIVGPRPHMLKHTEQYSGIIDNFMMRHFLKPGITGWAQVNGYRGETKDPSLMERRVEHDIWYMENWSLMLDVRVVFMTIINVFKGEESAY